MSKLSPNILSLLGQQYRHETINSLRYYQRGTFADYMGLHSIAEFFKKQADGERSHADKIYKYLNEKSLIVPISGLEFNEPDMTPMSDIMSVFSSALDVEKDTSARLENIVKAARSEDDTMTEQWLMDSDGLVKEQVEEENIYQTILDHAALLKDDPALYHHIDSFVRKYML